VKLPQRCSAENVVGAGRLRSRECETVDTEQPQAGCSSADSVIAITRRADAPAATDAASDAQQPTAAAAAKPRPTEGQGLRVRRPVNPPRR
jgi:hypothetical protein